MQQLSNKCRYRKCKAIAEYKTVFGDFCPYHLKVLKNNKRVKDLKEEKININPMAKKLLKFFKISKNVTIKA